MRSGHAARLPAGPVRADAGPVPGDATLPEALWQQIWFAARRRPWSSLALVPAHPGTSALFIAEALVSVGGLHGERPVKLLDAEGAQLSDVAPMLKSLAAIVGREEIAVVAVDGPGDHAATIPIVRAADAAILVVPLGASCFRDARRAMDLVGRDRFVGAVTLALEKKS
jgi:hypothetical protein